MPETPYQYLFGPVRSRRMGWSLGIDLLPAKTCTFDCPYCQIGRTVFQTVERREYVPVQVVLEECARWLAAGGRADYLTLAGSGEPTLHSRFGEVLTALRDRSSIRRALLSNGSLFWLDEVRAAACAADVVKGTLSAWDEESFRAIHRPHASLTFAQHLAGLRAMRQALRGEYWIEVFVVRGVNDRPEAMARIAELVRTMAPERVHLNTAVRPPAEAGLEPVSGEVLRELARLFTPPAEVIAEPIAEDREGPARGVTEQQLAEQSVRILAVIRRHPCTAREVAEIFGISPEAAERELRSLMERGAARRESRGGEDRYAGAG